MKTNICSNFQNRINKTSIDKRSIIRAMFELTYNCNFKCSHCYVPVSYKNKFKELRIKDVFQIIDQLSDMGCFYLGFTGGEPFIRKDIFDILWYSRKKGLQIIIYTNGFFINKETAKKISDLSFNKIDITVPSMKQIVFDKIVNFQGAHKKVFSAIEFLHRKNVPLGIKSCLLEANKNEINDIVKFSKSLGATYRLSGILMPKLDGSKTPFKYQKKCKFKNLNKNSCFSTKKVANALKGLELFQCGVGLNHIAINPSGLLKMCLMIDYPFYNILDTALVKSWEKLKACVDNIEVGENYSCRSCNLLSNCFSCPARSWLYKKNFLSCPPESYSVASFLNLNEK